MGKPPIWLLIRAHVQADPKKTAILAILAVVMGVVYVRLFLKPGGPDAAAAGTVPVVTPAADETKPATAERKRERTSRAAVNRPLERQLKRDPFVLGGETNQDPTDVGAETTQATGTGSEGEPLVLQSTLCGPSPMATISGVVVQPGNEFRGYVVEQIEPTRVILRQGSVRTVLSLK